MVELSRAVALAGAVALCLVAEAASGPAAPLDPRGPFPFLAGALLGPGLAVVMAVLSALGAVVLLGLPPEAAPGLVVYHGLLALAGVAWYRRLTGVTTGIPVPVRDGLLGAVAVVLANLAADALAAPGGARLQSGELTLVGLSGFLGFSLLVWWTPVLLDDLRERLRG